MNTRNNSDRERSRWTAVAHVKAKPGNDILQGTESAFVPIVGLAANKDELISRLKQKLESYDLMLGRIEDIEPLIAQAPGNAISPDLLKKADDLTPDNPIGFGKFHSYKED